MFISEDEHEAKLLLYTSNLFDLATCVYIGPRIREKKGETLKIIIIYWP